MLRVKPSGAGFGASATGVDLNKHVSADTIQAIRSAWLHHKVLAFPDQHLDNDGLERLTLALGGFGEDPFFEPIIGRKNISAVLREADETSPLFAENWHSDWSFLETPPAGTCLVAVDIPPVGGQTLFADQTAAFAALPEDRKAYLRTLTAVHSAKGAYSPEGTYGDKDEGRSMAIRPSELALETCPHPLVKTHPETGLETIFSTAGYIIGIQDMSDHQSMEFLLDLIAWQTRNEFIYRHTWEPGMVVIWDNRAVIHKATGGYEGYRRELHRTTIAAPVLG